MAAARDEYIVSYQVRAAGWLEECWQVTGPLKAYDSVTTLRRLDAARSDAKTQNKVITVDKR